MKRDRIQTVACPGERPHIPGGLSIVRSSELISHRPWPGGSAFSSWPPPRPGFRAQRGFRAGPASSAPSRGPAGGSALLANGRRAQAPSPAREEPPRSCATCGAWAPDPRPPPQPHEARGGRVRKRGLGQTPGPALGCTYPPGAHSPVTHLAAGLHGRAALEALAVPATRRRTDLL